LSLYGYTFKPPDRINSIALLFVHCAGPYPVVECDPAIFDMILIGDVCRSRRKLVGNMRERQIMRCDESDGAAIDERSDDRFSPGQSLV
jgi:hypothetical protein